jgi:ankyrin repeat protein
MEQLYMKKLNISHLVSISLLLTFTLNGNIAQAFQDPGVYQIHKAKLAYELVHSQGNPTSEIGFYKEIMATQASMSSSEVPELQAPLAILQAEAGMSEEAIKTIDKTLELVKEYQGGLEVLGNSGKAKLEYARARVEAYLGNWNEAQKSLKSALKFDSKMEAARVLLSKVEKSLALSLDKFNSCDSAFPDLKQLKSNELLDCIKQAPAGDPNLNMQIFLLGEHKDPAYQSTFNHFLKNPPNRQAAVHALSKIITLKQAAPLLAYLQENGTLFVLLKLAYQEQSQITSAFKQQLGNPLIKAIQSPKTDQDTRLMMIELLGVLRYPQAQPVFKQLKKFAAELINQKTSKGNFLANKNDYWSDAIDYGSVVELQLAAAENELSKTELMMLAAEGRTDRVQALLKKSTDPNGKDNLGNTALYWACKAENYQPELIKLLLDHGANPNLQNKEGITALMAAVGKMELTRLLIEKGANAKLKDDFERSASDLNRSEGHTQIAEYLEGLK